jgi:hypothetical protein
LNTAYREAAQCSPLSRFSKTTLSSLQLSELANDDITNSRILPLRFETAKVPAAPSTPVRPAKATAEVPRAPVRASRYCRAQYCAAAQCSPLSRRSKAPSQQLTVLDDDDVVPVPGAYIVPLRFKSVRAAPSTPVDQVKARGEEEPRAPIPVCVRSQPLHSQRLTRL